MTPTAIREVVEYRELLLALTQRDIRVRYKQAVFGILWAFFVPALVIGSGIIVRVAMAWFADQPLNPADVVAVTIKSLPWTLFTVVLGSVSNGLLAGMAVASKIYFPRQIIPVSNLLSSLFDFVIQVLFVIVVLVLIRLFWTSDEGVRAPVELTPHLLLIPVWIFILLMFTLGLGMMLGSANVFFRDVKYMIQVMLRFGIFFTPVYFSVTEMPGIISRIMLINPIGPLLEAISLAVMGQALPLWLQPWLLYSAVVSIFTLLTGYLVFRRSEHLFAELM